jgi:hypothetical protein
MARAMQQGDEAKQGFGLFHRARSACWGDLAAYKVRLLPLEAGCRDERGGGGGDESLRFCRGSFFGHRSDWVGSCRVVSVMGCGGWLDRTAVANRLFKAAACLWFLARPNCDGFKRLACVV